MTTEPTVPAAEDIDDLDVNPDEADKVTGGMAHKKTGVTRTADPCEGGE